MKESVLTVLRCPAADILKVDLTLFTHEPQELKQTDGWVGYRVTIFQLL